MIRSCLCLGCIIISLFMTWGIVPGLGSSIWVRTYIQHLSAARWTSRLMHVTHVTHVTDNGASPGLEPHPFISPLLLDCPRVYVTFNDVVYRLPWLKKNLQWQWFVVSVGQSQETYKVQPSPRQRWLQLVEIKLRIFRWRLLFFFLNFFLSEVGWRKKECLDWNWINHFDRQST